MRLAFLSLAACSLAACSANVASSDAPSPNVASEDATQSAAIEKAHTFTSAQAAPSYDGVGFTGAQLYRVKDGVWLDETAFAEALAAAGVTFFGEQHLTAPVQALERWVMGKLIASHADEALAMEHFQSDEQPVIDKYFRGEIDQTAFEAQAQVWPGYQEFWRPLVEDAHAAHRPLVGLNVPKEVLSGLYGQFPTWPLLAFNAIDASSPFDRTLPPRPLAPWDTTYQGWFETSFDYAAHGQALGLDYNDALHYFTDLAQVRDETMAYWVVKALASTPHVFVVAGDWHVQTQLAVPDRVARLAPSAARLTMTTSPADKLEAVKAITAGGHAVADYVITYR